MKFPEWARFVVALLVQAVACSSVVVFYGESIRRDVAVQGQQIENLSHRLDRLEDRSK